MISDKVEAGDLRDRPKHRSSYSTVEEDLAGGTVVMDGTALAAIDDLLSRNAMSKAPRAAGYRGSDFVPLAHRARSRMSAFRGSAVALLSWPWPPIRCDPRPVNPARRYVTRNACMLTAACLKHTRQLCGRCCTLGTHRYLLGAVRVRTAAAVEGFSEE
jgi:hypothetical protein